MNNDAFLISPDDPPAKQRIMEEGLRLFAKRGLSATSIRDIAAATGYTNPALYKHFRTKDALALVLFRKCYSELLSQVTLSTRAQSGFPDRFHAYLGAFVRFFDNHPHATIFTTDNLAVLWPQVSKDMGERTIITVTRDLLQQGRNEGLVTSNQDMNLQLILVTGMLGQMTRQLYLGGLKGPASKHIAGLENILRAALA